MANINTELTEEDAADLQFPKDENIKKAVFKTIPSYCENCSEYLQVPYINCVPCDVPICKECFVQGVEFSTHKNTHSYRVFDENFPLFPNSGWTANEEITLLNSLLTLGNWDTVAKQLPNNRSGEEVKQHYYNYYIKRNGSDLLPKFPNIESEPKPLKPYRFNLNDVSEPPRPEPYTASYNSTAGYNAARSEFDLEYDTNAEDLIANLILSKDKNDLESNLQCAIVRSYNRRLAERMRRKKIIRNHGLILVRKAIAAMIRYESTLSRSVYERMCRFMQFFSGIYFDFVLEGLHRAGELKAQISKLCEFRRKGIKSLKGAQLYLKLKHEKEEAYKSVKEFQNKVQLNWKMANATFSHNLSIPLRRREFFTTPLDVVGLPGYEKLLLNERELCKKIRLVPLSYLELKDILVAENKKCGFMKLQNARRLLKIDVNKTRKLYDFLIQEGYINKPK